jgi:hypothetical protein
LAHASEARHSPHSVWQLHTPQLLQLQHFPVPQEGLHVPLPVFWLHVPLEHVPAHPADVVQEPVVSVQALPHELGASQVGQVTAVQPSPVQHVPPQPSAAPHALPEQVGVQVVHPEPAAHVPPQPSDPPHATPEHAGEHSAAGAQTTPVFVHVSIAAVHVSVVVEQ